MADRYTHGHHESVLRSHRWRTAENSAGYLLPHLRAGQRVLDIGCGPGTITIDLARSVRPGTVAGIDAAPDVVDAAIAARDEAGLDDSAVSFAVGDVCALDAPDASFDLVHAHQVLPHLTDPGAALREMARVTAPGGLVAVRENDYGAFAWAPDDPLLDRWFELYHQVTRANRADADAGRHLPQWFRAAGLTDLDVGSSTWTFADADDRAWWGGPWADRVTDSAFAHQAVEYGLAERSELEQISGAFRRWATADDGVFVLVHVEVLAWV